MVNKTQKIAAPGIGPTAQKAQERDADLADEAQRLQHRCLHRFQQFCGIQTLGQTGWWRWWRLVGLDRCSHRQQSARALGQVI